MNTSIETSVPKRNNATEDLFETTITTDLKKKSVRGVAVTVLAKVMLFTMQTGSTIALARLLSPKDFGLQGMVVALTGLLGLFQEAGLSTATIQRKTLTHEQASTLFWINVALGAILTILAVAIAPFLAAFYKEPRLLLMTIISGTAFFFNSLAVQHRALLNRGMRFDTIAKIEVLTLAISSAIGISMAAFGYGYWALVVMAVSNPMITAVAVWRRMPWRPGRPTRNCGLRSLLQFGGTVTLNNFVVYLAYNTEKVLLGRFWGAEALGLYGRAYQLANLPVQQLNSAISTVAYPALSRLQTETERLNRSFLKGYSLIISLTVPVTISCAVFAEEIVYILLGPKWTGAAAVLRLLAPTVLALALVNPFGWFLQATNRAGRSLNIAFLIVPVVILGIVAGLSHGPTGVALGYSAAMVLLVAPIIGWSKYGTGITTRDYWNSIKRPMVSGVSAGLAGWVVKSAFERAVNPILLLMLVGALLLSVYVFILLVVMGQKSLYADLLSQMFHRTHQAPTNSREQGANHATRNSE